MITVLDFRNHVIVPALDLCRDLSDIPYGRFSVDLLIATAACETGLGSYLVAPDGRVGVYGMAPAVIEELMSGYVMSAKSGDKARFADLFHSIQTGGTMPYVEQATYDLRFATVLAHIHYYRQPQAPPPETTMLDLLLWYKTFWETPVAEFVREEGFAATLKTLTDLPFTH